MDGIGIVEVVVEGVDGLHEVLVAGDLDLGDKVVVADAVAHEAVCLPEGQEGGFP